MTNKKIKKCKCCGSTPDSIARGYHCPHCPLSKPNKKIKEEFYKNWRTDNIGIGKWSGMSIGGRPVRDADKIWSFIQHALDEARKEERKRIDELSSFIQHALDEARKEERERLTGIEIRYFEKEVGDKKK